MRTQTIRGCRVSLIVAYSMVVLAVPAFGQERTETPADQPIAGVDASNDSESAGPNAGRLSFIPPPPVPTPKAEPGVEPSKIHFNGGVDFTNAYFFRGIMQDRGAFIVQPYGSLSLDLYESDSLKVSVNAGMWNSFHDSAVNATATDGFERNWYEADWSLGINATAGKWTFGAQYVWETSPSGAFGTVQEIDLSITFDDSEALGAWKLSPSLLLAIETGSHFADGAGRGIYLQPSISPGFDADMPLLGKTSFTFPIVVGLSLSNYYQDSAGHDQTFGYVDIGAKAAFALPVPKTYGAWNVTLGMHYLALGTHAADLNGGKHGEVIGTIGIALSF